MATHHVRFQSTTLPRSSTGNLHLVRHPSNSNLQLKSLGEEAAPPLGQDAAAALVFRPVDPSTGRLVHSQSEHTRIVHVRDDSEESELARSRYGSTEVLAALAATSPSAAAAPPAPPRALSHADVTDLPYCLCCKEYLPEFLNGNLYEAEGWMEVKRPGLFQTWKRRWLVLLEHHVAYYEYPSDIGTTVPKGVFHLENSPVTDKKSSSLSFSIETAGGDSDKHATYLIRGETREEKNKWIGLLKSHDAALATSGAVNNATSGLVRSSTLVSEVNVQVNDSPKARGRPVPHSVSATSVSSDAPLEYVAEAPGAHHHNTRTAYCADCNSYIDLDLFTLAEYDGYLRKLGGKNRKKNWLRRWMALAVTPTGAHIAYYESPDDVAKYEPLNVLHVSPDSVSQADQDKHPLRFYVQTKSRQFEFDAEDADAFGEWLEAINGLAVDSGDDSD